MIMYLYKKAPFFIKFILIQIYGLFLIKKRYTKNFHKILQYYLDMDMKEEFHFDNNKMQIQLQNDTYYKWSKNSKIDTYPIIDKQIIKQDYEKIINKKNQKMQIYTSGTTGSGFKFAISQNFIEHQWAIFWKFRHIHGLSLNSWCAYISGKVLFDIDNSSDRFCVKSYPTKQLLMSQYHLNEKTIKKYLNEVKKNNIKWLHAYPSTLFFMANLIRNIKLEYFAKDLGLTLITTSSEKLFTYQKEIVENIFNCKIRELYGLTEGVVNVFECEKGTLHIDETFSYVELIPKEDSDEYKIVGTSYHNSAFPLLRYFTGDTCLLYNKKTKCICGRKSRIIKEILGRDDDYLLLECGTKIGRLDHIFKEIENIKEAQIIQKRVNLTLFLIVKAKEFSNHDEQRLIFQIHDKLGKNFRYKIKYVKNINKTKAGKHRLVINQIKNLKTETETLS